MELRQLRYFVAVAEALNFRKAAEHVHVSQPSLSAQIRNLEEEIGARLLNRNTHRVTLTPAGSNFLERSRAVLREVEEAARRARRLATGESGRLSIGFVASLGHGLLPGVLRTFRERFPDVDLQLVEMDTTQQIEALTANRLDLGFIGLGSPARTANLKLALVAAERLVAVVPEDHALAERKRVALQALSGERFLLGAREGAPLYNPWVVVLCHQAGFQPHIVQEAGQPITVMNYVAAGLGITLLPAQFGRLSMAGVKFVPLAPPAPRYRYCAAWSPKNTHPALPHFVEAAKRSLETTSAAKKRPPR